MSDWSTVMQRIADKNAVSLKRAFIDRVRKTDSATDWNEVEKAIPLGAMAVYNTIHWGKWAPGERLAKTYNEVYNRAKPFLQKYAVKKELISINITEESFSMPNPEAEAWLYQYAGKEIVEITLQERKAIQAILGLGQAELKTYKDTAKMLRTTLGLTENQARAVSNYYNKLRSQGRTEAQATKLAQQYHNKLLRYRSETIALTESFTASSEAWSNSLREASRDGTLDPAVYELYWLTAADERRCPICGNLAGATTTASSQNFDGYGKPPIHPRCRCQMIVRRKK